MIISIGKINNKENSNLINLTKITIGENLSTENNINFVQKEITNKNDLNKIQIINNNNPSYSVSIDEKNEINHNTGMVKRLRQQFTELANETTKNVQVFPHIKKKRFPSTDDFMALKTQIQLNTNQTNTYIETVKSPSINSKNKNFILLNKDNHDLTQEDLDNKDKNNQNKNLKNMNIIDTKNFSSETLPKFLISNIQFNSSTERTVKNCNKTLCSKNNLNINDIQLEKLSTSNENKIFKSDFIDKCEVERKTAFSDLREKFERMSRAKKNIAERNNITTFGRSRSANIDIDLNSEKTEKKNLLSKKFILNDKNLNAELCQKNTNNSQLKSANLLFNSPPTDPKPKKKENLVLKASLAFVLSYNENKVEQNSKFVKTFSREISPPPEEPLPTECLNKEIISEKNNSFCLQSIENHIKLDYNKENCKNNCGITEMQLLLQKFNAVRKNRKFLSPSREIKSTKAFEYKTSLKKTAEKNNMLTACKEPIAKNQITNLNNLSLTEKPCFESAEKTNNANIKFTKEILNNKNLTTITPDRNSKNVENLMVNNSNNTNFLNDTILCKNNKTQVRINAIESVKNTNFQEKSQNLILKKNCNELNVNVKFEKNNNLLKSTNTFNVEKNFLKNNSVVVQKIIPLINEKKQNVVCEKIKKNLIIMEDLNINSSLTDNIKQIDDTVNNEEIVIENNSLLKENKNCNIKECDSLIENACLTKLNCEKANKKFNLKNTFELTNIDKTILENNDNITVEDSFDKELKKWEVENSFLPLDFLDYKENKKSNLNNIQINELNSTKEINGLINENISMFTSDKNPVRHSLLNLVMEEDIPLILEAMAEEHNFVFEGLTGTSNITYSGIIHLPEQKQFQKKRNQNTKISFVEDPPQVFAYLDEESAVNDSSDGWLCGKIISFYDYQKMIQSTEDEITQQHLELARWQQQIQEPCTNDKISKSINNLSITSKPLMSLVEICLKNEKTKVYQQPNSLLQI